jgi:hypothetical protein
MRQDKKRVVPKRPTLSRVSFFQTLAACALLNMIS